MPSQQQQHTKVERGLYERGGKRGSPKHRFVAGFKHPQTGDWTMVTLKASKQHDARVERGSLIAAIKEGRKPVKDAATFEAVFAAWQEERSLSERTRAHEQHLLDRHLSALSDRRVQAITAADLTRLLRGMERRYSDWTRLAVYRVLQGTLALAVRDEKIRRSPLDLLAASLRPKQRNRKRIRRLDSAEVSRLVAAAVVPAGRDGERIAPGSERWRVAVGLGGYAGLRLGEIRGLRWGDIDLKAEELRVERALTPSGEVKPPKSEAGTRTVPILPELRRALIAWQLRSPYTGDHDYVVCSDTGSPAQECSLNRALRSAIKRAEIDAGDERLSWHSLRHSAGSFLATDLELPATTLARIMGHSDPGFTLRCYARDAREQATVTADVLKRAAAAGVGA